MTHKIEDHDCFQKLVDETGSDATFVKSFRFDFENGEASDQWVINLYHYTPSLGISTKKGRFIPNFCPICGEDFREAETEDTNVKKN